jgi:hypothetical protein
MTSIEWLEQQLFNKQGKFNKSDIEQAKEMHKQEIIDAGNLPKEKRWYDAKLYNSSGEQYYQETFVKGSDDTPMERKLLKSGFVDIVPKQETLYTEEQVRELLYYHDLEIKKHLLSYPIEHSLHSKMCDGINDVRNEYIQSLKQPKKD